MDPYMAMMSPERLEEEEMKALASQLRGGDSTGGRLSTSSLEPIQNQGRLMQTKANQQAQQVGLMQSRKRAADNKLIADAMKASGSSKDTPFNNITSAERRDAVKQMAINNSEAMLVDVWKPEFQIPLVGGLTQWAVGKGMPANDNVKDAVNYWKNYADWENKVRNSLFGSALTGFELEAWDRFTVNSKMQPDMVRQNMGLRKNIMKKRAAEEAATMIGFSWPVDMIQRQFKVLPKSAFDDLDAYASDQEAQYKAAYDKMGEGGPVEEEEGWSIEAM